MRRPHRSHKRSSLNRTRRQGRASHDFATVLLLAISRARGATALLSPGCGFAPIPAYEDQPTKTSLPGQRPVNFGLRFSMKACRPST
jgi:hypothetical protein